MTGEQTAKACVPNPKRNSGAESGRELLSTKNTMYHETTSKCKPWCSRGGSNTSEKPSSPDSRMDRVTAGCKTLPRPLSVPAQPSSPGSAQGGASWPGGNKSAASSIRSLQPLRRSRKMLNSQPRDAALPTHDQASRVIASEAAVVSLPDGPAMSQPQAAPASKPKFDNQGQYSRTSILRYEKIFGEHYISTGGAETTEDLCRGWAARSVPASGSSTSAAASAERRSTWPRRYGAKVTGIDLAEEMVAIALDRARAARALRRGQLHPGGRPRDAVARTSSTSSGAATPSCTSPTSPGSSPGCTACSTTGGGS